MVRLLLTEGNASVDQQNYVRDASLFFDFNHDCVALMTELNWFEL